MPSVPFSGAGNCVVQANTQELETVKTTDNTTPQLKYPVRVSVLVRMAFLCLLLWGIAVIEILPSPHYSIYEDSAVKIVASFFGFLFGTLFLLSFIITITHLDKHTLIIDKDGFHGIVGVSFIAWSEISSIEDKTLRYTLAGQRSNFLIICVRARALSKILAREKGPTVLLRRLGKSPMFVITNVKRSEIYRTIYNIEENFRSQLEANKIKVYH
jgi:hypothetical protein